MKRVLVVLAGILMIFGMATMAFAENVRYPIYEMDLVNASTVGHDSTVTLNVDGSPYLDMTTVNPGLGVFSISPYYFTTDDSGATITVNYSVTNVPNPNATDWSNSGTTNIFVASGTTNLRGTHWVFTPEFGTKYRFQVSFGLDVDVPSGLTSFKCKLAIQ